MKSVPLVILGLLLSLVLVPQALAKEAVIPVWVEAEIGINISTDCGGSDPSVLNTKVGEPGNCLLTVKNTGNIDDVLRLEAPLANPDNRGWMDYHFECTGTVGKCSLNYSYEESTYPPEVRKIRLSPELNKTRVYLEATGYRIGSKKIEIVAYSMTNFTMSREGNVTVSTEAKEDQYGPLVASGLNTFSILMISLFSCLIFYSTKFR